MLSTVPWNNGMSNDLFMFSRFIIINTIIIMMRKPSHDPFITF
jgi:hypothetical protein